MALQVGEVVLLSDEEMDMFFALSERCGGEAQGGGEN